MSEDVSKLPRRKWWLILLIPLGVCVAIWVVRLVSFQIRYAGMPIAAQTSGFAPDCLWSGVAVAWVDEDGNGVRDANEPPLFGATFYVDDTLNGFERVGWGESDWHGEAGVSVWLPGCPNARFEVYPNVPSGYRLTTAPRLGADVREYGRTFSFGFDYLPGVPTVTPIPPAPECASYRIGVRNQYDLSDLEAAPDGTVWAATYGSGVARYIPDRDEWVRYSTDDGLVYDEVRSITVADGNVVWFATSGGVSRFDGVEWTSYTVQDGLIGSNVYAITIGASGDVWFATQEGASRFDPVTGIWESYTVEDGLADDFLHQVAEMPDGSVWFFTHLDGISRLVPADDPSQSPSWTEYHYDYIDDITVAPDGSYWFAGSINGVERFDPETESWYHYDVDVARAVEAAPDGSIWIASGGYGNPVVYRLPSFRAGNVPQVWETYDAQHDFIIPPEYLVEDDRPEALTIAPNGALWIGTLETATRCVFPQP